ncbi:hypothetical protein J31TS4_11140 [Paenibacillus sp. J31TS4]|uniref:sensor histidine kinase n=1 Tax=Paenibacillus sp. J31TS4 TaxID=2807195 RepID=UPI001B1DD198|nr:PAS domain S-box protein [Paenibacillus sp. J31TS4]GIP37834.1 hypothetical protein J31TS4_11140 [Paenibacillus sp. J31TS4]
MNDYFLIGGIGSAFAAGWLLSCLMGTGRGRRAGPPSFGRSRRSAGEDVRLPRGRRAGPGRGVSEGREAGQRSILEHIVDYIAVSDANGTVLYASSQGWRPQEEGDAGISGFAYVHPDDLDGVMEQHHELLRTRETRRFRYRLLTGEDSWLPVECVATPVLGPDGEVERIVSVSRDCVRELEMEEQLKLSEEKARRLLDRYRRLVELSPAPIAVFQDGFFTYLNPAGLQALRADSLEQIVGTTLADWVHPDDVKRAEERIWLTHEQGYTPPTDFSLIRMDGTGMEISATSIYDPRTCSFHIVFLDTSARRQAERALLDSEERNRLLVELSPQAIVFHRHYLIEYINPAGMELFGYANAEELTGQPLMDLVHPACKGTACKRLLRTYGEQGAPGPSELRMLRRDGEAVIVEVLSASIPSGGSNAGLSLLTDITERKREERRRERKARRLRESEERYGRLQTSLDRLSHDLFGVLKVNEMESRLLKEVKEVLGVRRLWLLSTEGEQQLTIREGEPELPETIRQEVKELLLEPVPICELIDSPQLCLVKLGEKQGASYVLVIERTPELCLSPKRIWLKTMTRFVSVLYDSFHRNEDLTKELEQLASGQVAPPWLLRLLFSLSEKERRRLAQDLHDTALQEQILWYRRLEQALADPELPAGTREELALVAQGMLDVMYQIRMTCNELRPPFLLEEGLVSSLEALIDFVGLRADFAVSFDAADFRQPLNDTVQLGLYRIVQELLANAAKHAQATRVELKLFSRDGRVFLTYLDDGVGMELGELEDSFGSMGMYGMKERVRSMEGTLSFRSSPGHGLSAVLSVPAEGQERYKL